MVGHVDRAWGYSFTWRGAGRQLQTFESTWRFVRELSFDFKGAIGFRLSASSTDYDSNDDVFDRSVDNFSFSIELSALRDLLKIGQGGHDW